ncbi:MAG: hypothetical protein ACIALR_01340, partial [Blastopirellula sp. JB062]
KAESFLFPNFEADAAVPSINRVLLLDLGDWVPYRKGQAVKFNLLDKDSQGVKALIIKRDDQVIEKIERPALGVIERSFDVCGDYVAYCEMRDGSQSQACEFAVCDLHFKLPSQAAPFGSPVEVQFASENLNVVAAYVISDESMYGRHYTFLTDEDRKAGKVVIPADSIRHQGDTKIRLIGEHKLGRIKSEQSMTITN